MAAKYPVISYVPTKVDKVYDLHTRLNKMKYDEILNDLDEHFSNCYITNFDLINHECRGSELEYSKRFYETIFLDDVKKNIDLKDRNNFCASAIRSQRKDLHFEKKVIIDHFKKRDDLECKGIFLSSMRKRSFIKKKNLIKH